jgi:hypothetical protein
MEISDQINVLDCDRYPLCGTLSGPASPTTHCGKEKSTLPLPEIEPKTPGRPARSQSPFWLSHPGSCLVISINSSLRVVTQCSLVRRYRRVWANAASIYPEAGSNVFLWNVHIDTQNDTVSQNKRPQFYLITAMNMWKLHESTSK